jgi:hypothetical protein
MAGTTQSGGDATPQAEPRYHWTAKPRISTHHRREMQPFTNDAPQEAHDSVNQVFQLAGRPKVALAPSHAR